MDQLYFVNLTNNVIGELQITDEDLQRHPRPKDFSEHAFSSILHHIKGWSSETLGKIIAYGLGRGETCGQILTRRTTLEDAWFRDHLGPECGGGMVLEWYAATTLVASVYDKLLIKAFVGHLKKEARKGGMFGTRLDEACRSFSLTHDVDVDTSTVRATLPRWKLAARHGLHR